MRVRRFYFSLIVFCFLLTFWAGCQSTNHFAQAEKKDFLPSLVQVSYSWAGLSNYLIRQNFTLKLLPKGDGYQSTGELLQIPVYQSNGTQVKKYDTQVSLDTIRSILQTIHQDNWKLTKQPGEVIEHTDDYPNLKIEFDTEKGVVYTVTTTSNTATGAPWNLYVEDAIYTTSDPKISDAIKNLLVKIRPPEGEKKNPNEQTTNE